MDISDNDNTYHIPVMLKEVLDALEPKAGGIYFDGTLGGGGHSAGIMDTGASLIATDRDDSALAFASKRFEAEQKYNGLYKLVKSDFKDYNTVLNSVKIDKVDGVVLDLGVSSYQIDTVETGFSYRIDGPLDMRMDRSGGRTAYDIINDYSEKELVKIFFEYGEERFSRKIAAKIINSRKVSPIKSTLELAELIKSCVPYNFKDGHPAKRIFQAVRIEVNGELDRLSEAIEGLVGRLKTGGRIAVISFHSLEDRITKNILRKLATNCLCDKSLPVCVCGHKASVKLLGKYKAGKEELERNSRAKSATLRVAEKVSTNLRRG